MQSHTVSGTAPSEGAAFATGSAPSTSASVRNAVQMRWSIEGSLPAGHGPFDHKPRGNVESTTMLRRFAAHQN
jgi:hypothetical protein